MTVGYARLGSSRLEVSRLCLGTMNFGRSATAEAAFEIMDGAHAAGIPREEALAFQDVLDRVERGMGATYPSSAKYLLERRAQIGFQELSRWRPELLDHAALDGLAVLIDAVPAAHDRAVRR